MSHDRILGKEKKKIALGDSHYFEYEYGDYSDFESDMPNHITIKIDTVTFVNKPNHYIVNYNRFDLARRMCDLSRGDGRFFKYERWAKSAVAYHEITRTKFTSTVNIE
jgi:hypothetical protein